MRAWDLTGSSAWSLTGAAAWHWLLQQQADLQLPHELKQPPRGGSRLPARTLPAIRREDGDAACGKHTCRSFPALYAPRQAGPAWGPTSEVQDCTVSACTGLKLMSSPAAGSQSGHHTPAPPSEQRRHGALAVQQQPLQQQPVQQQQPQPLAAPQQEQKPPWQPRAVRAARRKLLSRTGCARAAPARVLPLLRSCVRNKRVLQLLTPEPSRRRRRSATPPPKAVHVGGLTRNVTAEHVKEIFGALGAPLAAHATLDRSRRGLHAGFYGTVERVELPLDARVRRLRERSAAASRALGLLSLRRLA